MRLILLVLFCLMTANAEARYGTTVEEHFLKSDTSPMADTVVSPMIGMSRLLLPVPDQVGAKVSIEVAPNGFIRALNDSVSAEAGGFIGRYLGDPVLYMIGSMRWDFHLHPDWTVFGAPGLAIRRISDDDDDEVFPIVSMAVGGFYNFQDNLALRAEVDLFDFVPRFGVAFRF